MQAALSCRLGRSLGEEVLVLRFSGNEGLIRGPEGAEVMEFRDKRGWREDWLRVTGWMQGAGAQAYRQCEPQSRMSKWRFRPRAQEGQCPGLETQLMGEVIPGIGECSGRGQSPGEF